MTSNWHDRGYNDFMDAFTYRIGQTEQPNIRMLDDLGAEATNHPTYIEGWNEARAMAREYFDQYVLDYGGGS